MPLEQCRPLNGGMVECGGFFVVACKLALRCSTALRALERRLRRLVKDGSGFARGLRYPLNAELSKTLSPSAPNTSWFRLSAF